MYDMCFKPSHIKLNTIPTEDTKTFIMFEEIAYNNNLCYKVISFHGFPNIDSAEFSNVHKYPYVYSKMEKSNKEPVLYIELGIDENIIIKEGDIWTEKEYRYTNYMISDALATIEKEKNKISRKTFIKYYKPST